MNYEIMDRNNKKQAVHINRIKKPTIQICGNLKHKRNLSRISLKRKRDAQMIMKKTYYKLDPSR
jgi:hypothetical protein